MSAQFRFTRHRTADEVIAQCRAQGLEIDTRPFERGSDHLVIKTPAAGVFFNTVSGRFFGSIPAIAGKQPEVHFNSDHDVPEAWYQTLVEFFYTDEDPPK